jgi:CheY-like chemotaxis protein
MPDNRDAQRLNVLVVDDDPFYRRLAQDSLAGHQKWIAGTVQEGLELFEAHMPDICFLDLSLPDDTGLGLLLEIRERVPEAFAVMLTTSRTSEDVQLAQRCAANGYITKPFSRKQLQASCEACVQHWNRIERMNLVELRAFRERLRADAAAMQEVLHKPSPEHQAALRSLMPQWQILVVGAQDNAAKQWLSVLEEAGFTAHRCASGAEALEQVQQAPYRLLLTEDTLADMDAAELLYRLRLNHKPVPAVVVTDADWKPRQPKWRKVGAAQVLCAPLSAAKLQRLVEKQMLRSLHELHDIVLHM